MAKKKGGKSSGNVSAGVHNNVSNGTKRLTRSAYLASGDRLLNQMKALSRGKTVKFTMENPNKEETNRQFVTVKVNGTKSKAR